MLHYSNLQHFAPMSGKKSLSKLILFKGWNQKNLALSQGLHCSRAYCIIDFDMQKCRHFYCEIKSNCCHSTVQKMNLSCQIKTTVTQNMQECFECLE